MLILVSLVVFHIAFLILQEEGKSHEDDFINSSSFHGKNVMYIQVPNNNSTDGTYTQGKAFPWYHYLYMHADFNKFIERK